MQKAPKYRNLITDHVLQKQYKPKANQINLFLLA